MEKGHLKVPPRTLSLFLRRLFGVDEIEQDRLLQLIFWQLLMGFVIAFSEWFGQGYGTINKIANEAYLCWPHFQNCSSLYVLASPPYGYSHELLYAALFCLILASAILAYLRRWPEALGLMLLMGIWKAFVFFFVTHEIPANFEYFHTPFVFVFLLARQKKFFLRYLLVGLYFLSAKVKFDEGWIYGTYFSSLQLGLPFVPSALVPIVTNFVILLETLGSWLLLSPRKPLRLGVLGLWCLFHIYSVLLVGYRYPLLCLPLVLILFFELDDARPRVWNLRHVLVSALLILVFALHFIPNFISGDEKLTLEGYKYGVFMFDANHQCLSTLTVKNKDGSEQRIESNSYTAMNRCSSYSKWFNAQLRCRRPEVQSIHWTFDHSVNGAPFRRIIDLADVCREKFSAFSHNEWIRSSAEEAPVVAYPEPNLAWSEEGMSSERKTRNSPHPQMLANELEPDRLRRLLFLKYIWWGIWLISAGYFSFTLSRAKKVI